MDKVDRRIKRTQQLLGTALVSLASEKDYAAITIKDITERADVAYVTFFRHYRSKDELLVKLLEDVIHGIEQFAKEDRRGFSPELEALLVFQHVQQNVALYQILLNNTGAASVRKQVKNSLGNIILQHISHHWPGENIEPIPIEIAANHIAVSFLALIEWWLDYDMPYTSEEMAQIYHRLIVVPSLPAGNE